MKKLFYLLLLMPFAFFASCDNDDDIAQVDLTTTMSDVTMVDNSFYAIQGDTISVDGVSVASLTGKNAAVTNVRYYINGIPTFGIFETPFKCNIVTGDLEAGTYQLGITATVLQVDKTITTCTLTYPIVIVDSEADLPTGSPAIGTYSVTARLQPKK